MSEDVKMEQQEQDKPTDQIMNGLNDVHLDEFDALYNQLQARPQDVGNWKRLVQLAEESDVDTKIRAAYDALLKQYPNTVRAGACGTEIDIDQALYASSVSGSGILH